MKLVYKGKEAIRILFPVDGFFNEGDTIEVNDKLPQLNQLKDLGFEEVQEIKTKEGEA